MQGRTWKNIENTMAETIKSYLLNNGGEEQKIKSFYEVWKIKFSDSTFTYYTKGTLYSTHSNSGDLSVLEAWKAIDSQVGSAYALPTKDFLIGLDETGKGEIIGHTVLTGVIFPKEIFSNLDIIAGPADTKKRHEFEYWDDIFKRIDRFRHSGFDFIEEKIPPWIVDRYNLNKIMDVTYQKILNIFFRKADIGRCRIVLDDYGIGNMLRRFLNFLQKQSAEVVVAANSEKQYLEVKIASLISKRNREAVIRAINKNHEFQIDGHSVGSGNAGDKQTMEWLQKWHETNREWPWFVKRSFRTIWKMEGRTEKPKKEKPPIREDLLSDQFLKEFKRGNLSIKSLSLICPACGGLLKSATFATFDKNGRTTSTLKCLEPHCSRFIEDAGMTLRYYCGHVIPDSSAIRSGVLSKDLGASKFFEGFTIILTPVVRKECDTVPGGKKEFDKLRKFNGVGQIKLECPGSVEDIHESFTKTKRDEMIINACLDYDAILLTKDRPMATFAGGKDVFTIII